jgi:hypothetical protein
MTITKAAAAVVTLVVMSTGADSCSSACEGLNASQRDRQAAANGYEVEREDSQGNTCELTRDGSHWEVDE